MDKLTFNDCSITFACIGDIHIKTDNISDIELFHSKLLNYLNEHKPTYIIVLGDVLDRHEHIHTLPLNKAYEIIDSLRKIAFTYVLVGNHDMINNSQFLTTNHWMNGMKEWENVKIVDTVIYNEKENFLLVPYVPVGRFEEALILSGYDYTNANIIFAHQEFKGCKMGAITSELGDVWKKEYPQIISGHIHSHQIINNVYYTGSSLQNAFGETENVYLIYYTCDNEKTFQKIDLGLPKKRIIYTNIDDVDDLKFKENSDDKIKITLSGNYEEFKVFKKLKNIMN